MIELFVLTTLVLGLWLPTWLSKRNPRHHSREPPPDPLPPNGIHQTLNVFVYPAKGQKPEQQQKDESECYTWARSQTEIWSHRSRYRCCCDSRESGQPGEWRGVWCS
jgi:hypothetical protein